MEDKMIEMIGFIVTCVVALLALIFSKKIFIFPDCYWLYRIYVVIIMALLAAYRVPLLLS